MRNVEERPPARFRWTGFAAVLPVAALVAAFSRFGDRLGCVPTAVVVALLWLLIARAAAETGVLRRRLFVEACLAPQAGLARLLRPRWSALLWQLPKALGLALLLTVALGAFDHVQQALLLLDVAVLFLLTALIGALLGGQLRAGTAPVVIRVWAQRANTALLWLALAAAPWLSAPAPAPSGNWLQVVREAAAHAATGCDALTLLARAQAVSEGLLRWAVVNLVPAAGDPGEGLFAWLLYLAFFGVSFLVAWAYSLALTGVPARAWESRDP